MKELYFKTEPGGRVAFGKLDEEQERVFITYLTNQSDAYPDLFEIAVSGYDNLFVTPSHSNRLS